MTLLPFDLKCSSFETEEGGTPSTPPEYAFTHQFDRMIWLGQDMSRLRNDMLHGTSSLAVPFVIRLQCFRTLYTEVSGLHCLRSKDLRLLPVDSAVGIILLTTALEGELDVSDTYSRGCTVLVYDNSFCC